MDFTKIPVSVDDTIMVKGQPLTAGSKILHNFTAPFDATVIKKLRQAGAEPLVHTASEEFGICGVSDEPEKPSAAVAAVAEGRADFALCNDISGAARRQAPEHKLCYIQPAYGTVSRFGLVASVSSMDQVGVVCKGAAAGFELLSVIAGHDENDGTTYPEEAYEYPVKNDSVKAAIITNALENSADAHAVTGFGQRLGASEEEFKYFGILPQVLYILSSAEISNNTTRYDGLKFGYRPEGFKGLNDLYLKARTEGFGADAKLASIMGCMVLSQAYYGPWYDKAMRLRRLIKEETDRLLSQYDVLLLPCRMDGGIYRQSALHALTGLTGAASVSITYGDAGVQLISGRGNEGAMLSAALETEARA